MSGLRALSFPLAFLLLAPVRAESLEPPCNVAATLPTTSVTYYVSTGGDDANDGLTEQTPWQTLDYAEANATVPGARIALKRGNVFEMATALGIHHGGTAGEPIVWDGDFWGNGGKATIRSSQDREAGEKAVVNIIGASHVVFQNIVVDGDSTNAFGIVIGGTDSYYSADGYQDSETDIIVQNNSILNCGNEHYPLGDPNYDENYYVIAVLIQTWNTDMWDITVRDNVVDTVSNHGIIAYVGRAEHGATPSTLHAMRMYRNTVTNFGIKIEDNRATGMAFTQSVVDGVIECNTITQGPDSLDGAGIVIAGNEDGTPQNAVIRYNDVRMRDKPGIEVQNGYSPTATFYGNLVYQEAAVGNAAIWIQIAAGGYTDGEDTAQLVFLHNTIVVDQGNAFMDDSTTPGVTVFRNNLVVNKGSETYGDPCYVANTAASVTHDHNACYRPQPGEVYLAIENDDGTVYRSEVFDWEPTIVIGDPLLTDLDGFDWVPAEDSPLRQRGVAAGILTDRNGNHYATPPTIGAFEVADVIFSDGFESGDLSSWAVF